MILLDANLLIYAIDSDSFHHAAARSWLEKTLSGARPVALPWTVILAFLRVTTHSRIMKRPLAGDAALEYVGSWLQQPCVRPLAAGDKHWSILSNLLRSTGMAGNLTADAHLAALAIEHGCEIYSTDQDFKRFPGVRHVNPIV